jgi:hypothetical protein
MTSWTPQPQGLEEILRTIHESTDMNIAVQRSITQVSVLNVLSFVSEMCILKCIWSPETEFFHANSRVHRLPRLYPKLSDPGGGPHTHHCWIPAEEQFSAHPTSPATGCGVCQICGVTGIQ